MGSSLLFRSIRACASLLSYLIFKELLVPLAVLQFQGRRKRAKMHMLFISILSPHFQVVVYLPLFLPAFSLLSFSKAHDQNLYGGVVLGSSSWSVVEIIEEKIAVPISSLHGSFCTFL